MGRMLEELSVAEMQEIIQEIMDKRDKSNDKQWLDIVRDYDLDCSPEVLRKLSVGVQFARKAGMRFATEDLLHLDKSFTDRQKIYDLQRKIRQSAREFSRTELICEHIERAIKELPPIIVENKPASVPSKEYFVRDLVLGIGDFHYGAEFRVTGLYGEVINEYNSKVFERRMECLSEEVSDIVRKESPDQLTIMIAGDMIDGLLRPSQLQRLEYGIIESTIRLGEFMSYWLLSLVNKINIPIRVYAVRGNHGEIRPLGSKAGQFPEENMERIVMHYLYTRFKDQQWITIENNDAPMLQAIDVCGYSFLLIHGQNENISSMAKDYVNLYNKPMDTFMVGHLHKSQSFVSGIAPETNIHVERVPSICGVDPYAQTCGFNGQAGATAILVEEGRGYRCIYPIILK